jgi:hypothetical protein
MIHHWDFYGPDATKTAEHFKKHLDQFLVASSIDSQKSGYFSADAAHTCIWLEVVLGEHSTIISERLKPQRSLTHDEHSALLSRIAAARNESP